MSSLSSLSATLLLLPGAAIVERWGNRKNITLLGGFLVGRGVLLLSALAPLAFANYLAAWVIIGLVVVRSGFMHLAVPASLSLIGDIVPVAWRGRYFAARNIAIGVAGMATTFLMGQLITTIGGLTGYQWALGLAFALSMVSAFNFARIEEPPVTLPLSRMGAGGTRLPVLSGLRAHPGFLAFCITAGFWNLSLNVAAPFFNIYLVEGLNASASFVGATTVASGLAGLPGQRLFGTLADRWGSSRVQLITGLFIPLLPFTWALIRSPWQMMPISLVGGFIWAGYSLANFNLLLELAPEERRERYTALYQMVVMTTVAGGAALGGLLATRWGYAAIFVVSGTGRLIAALLFAVLFHSSVRLKYGRLGV
jgi:MFS family permease